MRNASLDEARAGIKISGRNINNLRYSDDTTLMAESEKELNSLLRREESDKADLKCNVKTKNKQKKTTTKKTLRSWHPVPLLYGK